MDFTQIEQLIQSENPQDRMRAITALRHCDAAAAVPLLIERMQDQELIIRSFVAIGLGHKRSEQGYAALLELLQHDQDPNVRAEAANSIAFYGSQAIPRLTQAFRENSDWVIRLSILPALAELEDPQSLWDICAEALSDPESIVQDAAIDQLAYLNQTEFHDQALHELLELLQAQRWQTRQQVAIALAKFNDERAKAALLQLRSDEDYRVVAAALQPLMA